MSISPWELFVDLGLAAVLLLAGQLLRSKSRFLQRLFLPASVLGGFLGLALGPNGLGVLRLSEVFSIYPGILIALIFAALPFASEHVKFRALSTRLTNLWAYSTVATLLQWSLGIVFTLAVLRELWPGLNPGFGALIAAGFVGGHGTAAAIGATFQDLGWTEATSLAMTSATVGILSSIIGGMIWVKWGSLSGQARFISRFDELPDSLRTGLVREDERNELGRETVSSSSIDSLAFHFCLICFAAVIGYFLSKGAAQLFPPYKLPVFSLAYITSLILHRIFRIAGVVRFIDRKTMGHLSGTLTDFLVVFGIASIKLSILVKYALPLALLFAAGIIFSCLLFRLLGPCFFLSYWFEKSLFTWGWITGVTAMGIALLRIVDPNNESSTLDDFGIAYLFVIPMEIGLVTFGPQTLLSGHGWMLAGITTLPALFLVLFFPALNRRQKRAPEP